MSRKPTSKTIAGAFAVFIIAFSVVADTPEAGWPRICHDSELTHAIRIIDSACEDLKSCDHRKIRRLNTEIDKATLLAALRNPYLQPLHLFFKPGESSLDSIISWPDRRPQLDSLKFLGDPANSVIYVIGQASTLPPKRSGVDPAQYNFSLSQDRMDTVMKYLKQDLHVNCAAFRGGWLGDDVFQLNVSDAGRLGIHPTEYENNPYTLNQAVHIFVFPCAPLLPHGRSAR